MIRCGVRDSRLWLLICETMLHMKNEGEFQALITFEDYAEGYILEHQTPLTSFGIVDKKLFRP